MINTFKTLLAKKRDAILKGKKRYVVALEKLELAGAEVLVMQENLNKLQPQLTILSATVEEKMKVVLEQSAKASEIEQVIMKDEKIAGEQARDAQAIKDECDANLSEAMLIINTALAALNTLTPADMNVIKTMKNPPKGVKLVMEAICIFKDIRPEKVPAPSGVGAVEDYWGPSKKVLSDTKFLESLLTFDKDNIAQKIMDKLKYQILDDASFDPDQIKTTSTAAEGILEYM
ncbi:unnamed protein product, partial [Callosobruchus maculatus]